MPLLLLAAVCSCRSSAKPAPRAASSDSLDASPIPDAGTLAAAPWRTSPVFSAPIAAARSSAHISVVAGLVVAQKIVRVVGLRDGRPSWTTDIMSGAKWSAGAELGIQRAADGVAVVWRDGIAAGGSGALVLLGAGGEPRGAPIEVGAAMCTTSEGLSWIEPRGAPAGHPVRVFARAWVDPTPREILVLSPDRSPSLVCGTHSAFLLGDGDDDLTVDAFMPNDPSARRPTLVMRDADFADEEREHEAFTIADELEIVRVGVTGSVAIRTIPSVGAPSAWRRIKHVLSEDDDLVTVDGESSRALLVFTHDSDTACPTPESGGQRVRALDVERSTGADRLVELAATDCQGQRGPFWIPVGLPESRGPIVAWVERAAKQSENAAPISGLAYRVLSPDGVRTGQISITADAVVDGDCDDAGCFAAALLRDPGSDGMSPGAIGVFAYP
jgi:hypothetical protein